MGGRGVTVRRIREYVEIAKRVSLLEGHPVSSVECGTIQNMEIYILKEHTV